MIRALLTTSICCLALIGCKDSNDASSSDAKKTAAPTAVTIPASSFTTKRPENVKDLIEVKKNAKTGDDVVFLARVGGKIKTFTDSHAIFVAADPSLISCELMGEEDHCTIPEDYCCEDPQKMKAGLATIQFVDDQGRPLKTTAMGAGGLEPLKYVVIDGTIRDMNDEGLFIVDAKSIWVGGKPNRSDNRAGSMSAGL
tara:strand:+ start:522 stop:1115 length:594 start_codon:yes stop_codon:yes gene_type:complete